MNKNLPIAPMEFEQFNNEEGQGIPKSAFDNFIWGFLFLVVLCGSIAISWQLGLAVGIVVGSLYVLYRKSLKTK